MPELSTSFSWVPLFTELGNQLGLVSGTDQLKLLRDLKIEGLNDRTAPDGPYTLPLDDLDPFTFFSLLNKFGTARRLQLLGEVRLRLGLMADIPTDLNGVPTSQAQSVWLFGHHFTRRSDDIEQLRTLHRQLQQDAVTAEQFNHALTIRHTGKAKLTEAFFYQKPDRYLPINGQTIPFLRKRNINPDFDDYAGYLRVLDDVRQADARPFYEISYVAYLENRPAVPVSSEPPYFCVGTTYNRNDEQLPRFISDGVWENGYGNQDLKLIDFIKSIPIGAKLAAKSSYTKDGEKDRKISVLKVKNIGEVIENPGDGVTLLVEWEPEFESFELEGRGYYRSTIQAVTNAKDIQLIFHRMPKEELANDGNFWKYSPGSQSVHWPHDQQHGLMAVRFEKIQVGDLRQYPTLEALNEAAGMTSSSNQTWNLDLFKNAHIGDVVFANQGRNRVVGIGVVTSEYHHFADQERPHQRRVNWIATKPWEYQPNQYPSYTGLFRPDTFSPTKLGPWILEQYLTRYPEYRDRFAALNPTRSEDPTEEVSAPTGHPLNVILYGPPGTGKTYTTIDRAVQITGGHDIGNRTANKQRFDALLGDQIEFITFHQNYTYEDFVLGLKPDTDGSESGLRFRQHEGIFYQIAHRARQNYEASQRGSGPSQRPFAEVFAELVRPLVEGTDEKVSIKMASGIALTLTDIRDRSIAFEKANGSTLHTLSIETLRRIYEGIEEIRPNGLRPYYKPLLDVLQERGRTNVARMPLKNYVLVIDEINRANISRVFGELITLLEDDKRLGQPNSLQLKLPNGERFALPPNLYLIGTMNTADKSIALLDIALRRRFEFEGLFPSYDTTLLDSAVAETLRKLNAGIYEKKKSADFLVGHAYLIGKTESDLPNVFNKRVIPLLMEYFGGRTDTVQELLRSAGVPTKLHPFTFQLEWRDGDSTD